MTEQRGSPRPLGDILNGLLSNPAVLEGLIAGISAISASRRTKASGGERSQSDAQSGSLLDALPGILPLLSVLTSPQQDNGSSSEPDGAAEVDAPEAEGSEGGDLPFFAETDEGETGDEAVSAAAPVFGDQDMTPQYVDREAQRENLLLAIRPFLSDSRRSAADAMVQVNKLSGIFRRR